VGQLLGELAVKWAMLTDSFRKARDRIKDLYGEQLLSHEAIRQLTYDAIRKHEIEHHVEEKKETNVLFIEIDGVSTGSQDADKDKVTSEVGVMHTGWELKSGYGDKAKYSLKDPVYFGRSEAGEKCWEDCVEIAWENYDMENTVVVINGDGAPWIRKGTEHFKDSIYKYNTYHVFDNIEKKLPKELIREYSLSGAIKTLATRGNPDGMLELLNGLSHGVKDQEEKEGVEEAIKFVESNHEYIRDYKERLEEIYDINTEGFQNLGASEAVVSRFSNRIKGRSWKKKHLEVMITGLSSIYNNTWEYTGRDVASIIEKEKDSTRGAGRIKDTTRESKGYISGGLPAIKGSESRLTKTLRTMSLSDFNI